MKYDSRLRFIELFTKGNVEVTVDNNIEQNKHDIFDAWREWGYNINLNNNGTPKNHVYLYKSFLKSRKFYLPNTLEYFVVPGIHNPRWLFHNSYPAIVGHGPIIKPTTLKSRVVWACAKFLHRFGLFSLFFPFRVRVHADWHSVYGVDSENSKIDIIYTGASGPYQKFTLREVDSNNNPVAYIKLAYLGSAKEKMSLEIDALTKVRNNLSNISKLTIPRLTSKINVQSFLGYKQESILGKERVSEAITPHDQYFFTLMLDNFQCGNLDVANYLNDLQRKYNSHAPHGTFYKFAGIFGKQNILLVESHGDYIPWNRFIGVDNKLKIIDWENYSKRAFLYDPVYFIIHSSILTGNSDSDRLINKMINIMHATLKDSSLSVALKQQLLHTPVLYIYPSVYEIYLHYLSSTGGSDIRMLDTLSGLLDYCMTIIIDQQSAI